MMGAAEPQIVVIIDTREQAPYQFTGSVRQGLSTGDYSVEGLVDRISIERKSSVDLLACIGRERDRFERELQRLHGFPYRALVVEASLREILTAPSQIHPNAIIGTLASWIMKYQLPVIFCGSRRFAEMLTLRMLEKAAKYCGMKNGREE